MKTSVSGESCRPADRSSDPIRIIGIGNSLRGDDAIGLLVARRLREQAGQDVQVIEADRPGVALLDLMEGAEKVVLVDAASGSGPEGRIHRVDVAAGPIGREIFPTSTHAIGLAESVEIARALGRLPATTVTYGIEVGSTEIGSGLSPAVAAAVDEAVARILRELDEWKSSGKRRLL